MAVGNSWFVAQTKSLREQWAADNIIRQGYTAYIPKTAVTTVERGRKCEKVRCLFPGYLFVQTDGTWRFLTGTFGVANVIMQGQQPATMPDTAIAQLKARENANGLITLPKPVERRFKPGDTIRVSEGAFSGFEGIWEGDAAPERVKILLQILGRKTRVLIGEDMLEKV